MSAEFRISYEPIHESAVASLPKKIRDRLQPLHQLICNAPEAAMEEVKYYVSRFPEVPCFQNWLAKCYHEIGRGEEARALARHTADRHPDYFFGTILLAQFLLWEGKLDEVDKLLGDPKFPTAIAPNRKEFHFSEVIAYFHVCGQFFLLTMQFDAALRCLDFMNEHAPVSGATKHLAHLCGLITPEGLAASRFPEAVAVARAR